MITKDDIVIVKGKVNSKLKKALKVLYWGSEPLRIGEYDYMLAECAGGVVPVIVLPDGSVLGQPDMTLTWLSQQVDKLDNDYLDELYARVCMAITVTELHHPRGPR